ncbi:hypothetical protein BDZ89DRAFT_1078717 [Hymenopellis radicata]|nr:hypothetical protein BDZ89DRAFT_1078717 [Hymenopellis radicata]
MSTSATEPTKDATKETAAAVTESPKDKGKGKAPTTEDAMEEDEDSSDEEEDDEEEEEEDSEEEDDDMEEIDPSAIVTRRTRGKKVDYTSAEALSKAGLKKDDKDEEDDEDAKMKD